MERVSFDVSVKKSGFAAFLLVGVLIIGMGLFVSCGYKPEEMQSVETQEQGNGGESEEITDSGDSSQTAEEDKDTEENLAESVEKIVPTKDEVLAIRAKGRYSTVCWRFMRRKYYQRIWHLPSTKF